jgi:predicted site-specific integrase-resolvase
VTLDELRRLPPTTVRAEVAFEALGISRTTGYQSIRDGSFPVPVLRLGRVYRVPTLPLLGLLGVRVDGGSNGPP